MTEEIPDKDPSDYSFPDQHFSKLQELEENEPSYSIIQGALYRELSQDTRFNSEDALDVSRYLNNGEVEEAEDTVYEVLEGGNP